MYYCKGLETWIWLLTFFIFFNKSRTFWSSFNSVIDWSFLYFVVLVPSPLLLIPCHRSFLDSWRHSCYHSFAVRLCSFISWLIFQDRLYWKVTSKSRTENKGEKPNYCLEGWSPRGLHKESIYLVLTFFFDVAYLRELVRPLCWRACTILASSARETIVTWTQRSNVCARANVVEARVVARLWPSRLSEPSCF